MSIDKARILLVEDNPSDAKLLQLAVRDTHWIGEIEHVVDGEKAIAALEKARLHPETLPDLILLDLNMPRVDGFEVLEWLKRDEELRTIPVVVLTTSEAKTDIKRAYSLFANSYICKPTKFTDFVNSMKSLENYWFRVARLAN